VSREFHEGIGQYTEGDINNYGIQINVAGKSEQRGLVPAQKQELYELGLKCVELGADSKEIWRRVFAELSVKQIGDITSDQFQQARNVLQARLDQLMDEDDKRRLIGKILRAATEKDAKAELNNYCDLTFGRTHLNHLKRADLQRVLEFVQGFEVKPLAAPQPAPAPIHSERLALREFLITYKSNAFWLFIFGVIVDRFWFGH
jgi:hypothetical protein